MRPKKRRNGKISMIVQVAVMLALCIILTGILTYFTQIDNSVRLVTRMTEEKAETVFGKADEFIVLPELPDEFAMITPKMSLREYEERASQISGSIISMLRVKD